MVAILHQLGRARGATFVSPPGPLTPTTLVAEGQRGHHTSLCAIAEVLMRKTSLPIDSVLPELVQTVGRHPVVLLHAPTGAGKTTRVPSALLLPKGGAVWVTQPRRVAARAAAKRIAFETGERVGEGVGYHVRFDHRASQSTRVLCLTEGIALRRLQSDPFLEGVDTVVIDEFHERHLSGDLLLALLLDAQKEARPDLRIIVMSATLDVARLSELTDNAPVISSEGRTFPVDIRYEAGVQSLDIIEHAALGTRRALRETDGTVLTFLPGVREIHSVAERLSDLRDVDICPLYGDLRASEQDAALTPGPRRRIVLATNVAESSLTIPDVTAVVDTGVARVLRFDPAIGLNRLEVERISLASADQRAGRAGRLGPGVCYRLWTPAVTQRMSEHVEPDIARIDLSALALELFTWGVRDPSTLRWLTPPEPERWETAVESLTALGALRDGVISPRGRELAQLPLEPRLGVLLLDAKRLGVPKWGALAAAILSERDLVARSWSGRPATVDSPSDLVDLVEAVDGFRRGGTARYPPHALWEPRVHAVIRVAKALLKKERHVDHTANDPALALRQAIGSAFVDRVAQRRGDGPRALLRSGRGAVLARSSAVLSAPLFVAVSVRGGERGERSEGRIQLASAVEESWLAPTTELRQRFDDRNEQVVADKVRALGAIVLSATTARCPRDEATTALLAEAAARIGARSLRLPESLARRVALLRQAAPELGLPPCDLQSWIDDLPSLASGLRSFDELRRLDLAATYLGRIPYADQQTLAREAPTEIRLQNGSKRQLSYDADGPPVLAARIQHLFGVRETPRIARGRVAVVVHLLAPNRRPQQVTQDLESFWRDTYPQVRKELRGRYPKHAWPEDPHEGA